MTIRLILPHGSDLKLISKSFWATYLSIHIYSITISVTSLVISWGDFTISPSLEKYISAGTDVYRTIWV